MAKHDKRFQVMRTDGETMKTKADGRFLTDKGAAQRRRELYAQLPDGSSDSLTVRETRRKGRS